MKNESTTLARQREIKHCQERESWHRPDIIFLVFCYSSCMCLLGVLSSWWGDPLFSHFYISVTGIQLFLFPLFYPMSTSTALPLELLSVNHSQRPICYWYISIFNLGICCYLDLNLGNFQVWLRKKLLLKQSTRVPNYFILTKRKKLAILWIFSFQLITVKMKESER